MSTQALYTFIDGHDNQDRVNVYKHHDGYPSGACEAIQNALKHSWQLPRFEADEFAAAFCAGNKPNAKEVAERQGWDDEEKALQYVGGGVRILPSGPWEKVAAGDNVFRYEIKCVEGELFVSAYSISNDYKTDKWSSELLFVGTLAEFEKFVQEKEAAV